jgi:hypothetical protein
MGTPPCSPLILNLLAWVEAADHPISYPDGQRAIQYPEVLGLYLKRPRVKIYRFDAL